MSYRRTAPEENPHIIKAPSSVGTIEVTLPSRQPKHSSERLPVTLTDDDDDDDDEEEEEDVCM